MSQNRIIVNPSWKEVYECVFNDNKKSSRMMGLLKRLLPFIRDIDVTGVLQKNMRDNPSMFRKGILMLYLQQRCFTVGGLKMTSQVQDSLARHQHAFYTDKFKNF